jgi:hemolysin III
LYTPEEEVVNSISHILSAVITILVTLLLGIKNNFHLNLFPLYVMACCMSWVFFASYLYHSTKKQPQKERNRFVDMSAIYIAIIGNGCAFALLSKSITLIVLCITILTILSIFLMFNLCLKVDSKKAVFVFPYILMGWIAIFPASGLFENTYAQFPQIFFLLGGGIAYSIGIIFFIKDTTKWYHAIWHFFVMLGFALHYIGLCISLEII